MTKPGRRFLIAGVPAAAFCFTYRTARASPVWRARQFHNQPAESHLHGFLVQMRTAVRAETNGRLDVTVYPQNARILAWQMLGTFGAERRVSICRRRAAARH